MCKYSELCSGCQLLQIPFADQQKQKMDSILGQLQEIGIHKIESEWVSIGPSAERDRGDLVWGQGSLGLYAKSGNKSLLDLDSCPHFSSSLALAYLDLRKILKSSPVQIQRGSLRIRISPKKDRGLWLDLSNLDVQKLFEEKTLMLQLLDWGIVEVGQRHKRLRWDGQRLRLNDPQLANWFESQYQGEPVPLFGTIGSFTQPSMRSNRFITETISEFLSGHRGIRLVEFGSGNGNLTFPILQQERSVVCCESDNISLVGLRQSLEYVAKFWDPKIPQRVHLQSGDFQKKDKVSFLDIQAIVANPPRSGMMGFLDDLNLSKHRPETFVSMSCHAESFLRDSVKLKSMGYRLTKLKILDQFPQTHHVELISLWNL